MKKIIGSIFLVTGTSVGAGMLALPIVTGSGGFIPALAMYLLIWVIMTFSGLLYLEACLRIKREANIISMADHFLGKKGRIFSWIVYLFLFYCLSVAYIAGGTQFFYFIFRTHIPQWLCSTLFAGSIAFIIFFGAARVDRANKWLIGGLVLSYLGFIFVGIRHVEIGLLQRMDWSKIIWAAPVILVSFGYHGIIPSLTNYLKRNITHLRIVIVSGTSLTLFIYIIWELLILGIIPLGGENGLLAAKEHGYSAIQPLEQFTKAAFVSTLGQTFGFFAITTSFLGVGLGLFDFFADGLKIAKRGWKKVIISCFSFLPPLLITFIHPNIFIRALGYAGGIGGNLLLVFLPACMVWSARYWKKEGKIEGEIPGGKTAIFFIFLFVLFELVIEFLEDF